MFFRNSNEKEKANANIACWFTFAFWGITLLINSIYESNFETQFPLSPLAILIAGLIVFFTVDFVLNFKNRKK
ncbi:hypothetical protein [Metabacillus idriensis]|uniref:hypothetical protein n=1 Tax=Metabacillus idriensis TaxID=324768 RepID=UPI00174D8308|nr:hypothetical protein [Metabacillus idriensis]